MTLPHFPAVIRKGRKPDCAHIAFVVTNGFGIRCGKKLGDHSWLADYGNQPPHRVDDTHTSIPFDRSRLFLADADRRVGSPG